MSSVQYPFIDIVVLDGVRDQFLAGRALVLFSRDMKDVLWANGPGAALFNASNVYDLMEQGVAANDLTLRQLRASAGVLKAIGDSRSVTIRAASGFDRIAAQAKMELIRLPDAQQGVLISLDSGKTAAAVQADPASILDGLQDPNTHIALLSENGALLAASDDFDSLHLYSRDRYTILRMLDKSRERLRKHQIPSQFGFLPGAVAKLSDQPGIYLLFAVQPQQEESEEAPPTPAEEAALSAQTAPLADTVADNAAAGDSTDAEESTAAADLTPADNGPKESAYDEALTAISEIAEVEEQVEEDPDFTLSDEPEKAVEDPDNQDLVPAHNESSVRDASPALSSSLMARRETRTTRFVWKIDADGNFSEISPELAAAVGPHAAEIAGLSFGDVAALFNLDPEGRIAELLNRRDTWSGKTIWWPLEGTSLSVPIDLAALPTYSRSREFDGFRGFGIIRLADAKEDPLALGLTLVSSEDAEDNSADDGAREFLTFAEDDAPEPEPVEEQQALRPESTLDDTPDIAATEEPALADAQGIEDAEANTVLAETAVEEPAPEDPAEPMSAEAELPAEAADQEPLHAQEEQDEARLQNATPEEALPAPTAVEEDATQQAEPEPAQQSEAAMPLLETEQPGIEQADSEQADADLAVAPEEVEAFYAELETLDIEGGAPLIDPLREDEPETPGPMPLPAVEKPVLRIVDNPNQRYSDKVIRFDERRARNGEVLSPGEQAAFQEIARRLEAFRRGEEAERAEKRAAGTIGTPDATENMPANAMHDASAPLEAAQTPAADESGRKKHGSLLDAVPSRENEQHSPLPTTAEEDVAPAAAEAHQAHNDAGDGDDDRITLAQAYAQAASLRPRPELSAEVIDQMPVALLVHSGDDLIHANAEFLRLTGYGSLDELAEIGGLDALLQRHELDDKAAEAGGMVVVRADDVIVPVTARLQSVRYDGATALILALMPAQAIPEFSGMAAPSAPAPVATATSCETTEQASEIARMSVEIDELRAILDTATDGVVTLGAEGDIRSMNRAASALFNYDNAETLGKPFVMLFAHESQKSVLDYLSGLTGFGVASLLNDGREVIGRESGGGFVPLFMTIGKLTSSNGFCAVIRDITQWKRTEDELRSAKRAAETANAHKSEFLAHVSHEIRTPLNAIIGFADMMASERLGPVGHSRYVEYANDIGRSGRHVLDIVNDLLDISKIEAGEMDMDFASVGLNETIAESVSILQPQANTQRVIIRTALNQSVPPVVADLRSIKQIVLNILSNAIRFTPSGGQIVVSTSYESNGSVVLRVRDTGIGMTRSELELAMKPFRQVAGASRKRGDGTGLGLPLTKAMVDANRAVFSIHSAPNEGTLVEVTFPSPRVLAN